MPARRTRGSRRRRSTRENAPYNGYSWKQRDAILDAIKRVKAADAIRAGIKRLEAAGEVKRLAYLESGGPCEVCRDLEVKGIGWHSEDYSQPYLFAPPATFIICTACHQRLHKRFNRPEVEWRVFLVHLRAGGYGREFARKHSKRQRDEWMASITRGDDIHIDQIRDRTLSKADDWWQTLSLDKTSLRAAWARPRPLHPRPPPAAYREALFTVKPSEDEMNLLQAHLNAPHRSASMGQLAKKVFGRRASHSRVNLVYGEFAGRLAKHLGFKLERREDEDGSAIQMSVVAEGWQPDEGEFEWVMVESLAKALEHKSLPITAQRLAPTKLKPITGLIESAMTGAEAQEDLLRATCSAIDDYIDNLSNPGAGVYPHKKVREELLRIRKTALGAVSSIEGMTEHASVLMGYGAVPMRGVWAPAQFAVRPPDADIDPEHRSVALVAAFVRPIDAAGREIPLLEGGSTLERRVAPDMEPIHDAAQRATVALAKVEQLRPRPGAPSNRAARQLAYHLGTLWADRGLTMPVRSKTSLWCRFVSAVFEAAGVGTPGTKIALEVARHFAQTSPRLAPT